MTLHSSYDHGPLNTYEIIYTSGHVEHIDAHQVTMPERDIFPFSLGGVLADPQRKKRSGWTFHGGIDGRWEFLLFVDADDVHSVRNLTHTRDSVGGE